LKQKFANVAALENAIKEKEGEIDAREADVAQKQEAIKSQEEQHKKHVEAEHKRLDEEIAKLPEIDLIDDEGEPHALKPYPTTPIPPEEPKLSPKIEVVKEAGFETYGEEEKPEPTPGEVPVEVFEKPQPRPPLPTVITEPEATDLITQAREEAKAEKEAEIAEDEEALKEVEAPTVEETMEADAENIATGKKQSREFKGKGVFSEGVPEKVAHRIDERVEEIVHGEGKHDKTADEADEEDDADDEKEGEEE
jgi:hypothetical protein